MKEGTPLEAYLDELNYILMELRDINLKVDDKDATMILLPSLMPSYENLVSSPSIENYCITLEDVKSKFCIRELHHKGIE